MNVLRIAALVIGASRIAAAQWYPTYPPQIPPYDEPAPTAQTLSDDDKQVIAYLHGAHLLEAQVGRLAASRGSPPMRDFGTQLVAEHRAADSRLIAYATSHGMPTIPVDAPLDADHRPVADALAELQTTRGTEFDDAFLDVMVDAQEREQAYVEDAIARADDPELEQLLRDTDGMLRRQVINIHTLKTLVP